MKVVGLVTEYNPFHNGHKYHLEESKRATGCDYSIAVMSGHFLQRGEPAILNKWTRAKAAVESGVDLVIEIPTMYACSSAEYFAYGSVALLNSLGIVDKLCFGSEDGQLDAMNKIVDELLSPSTAFNDRLLEALQEGHSFPKARSLALDTAFEFKANNILGIEYLKALKVLNSDIVPETIQRIQAEYLDENLKGTIASATAIRKHAENLDAIKDFVPEPTYKAMLEEHVFKEHLTELLLYKIRTTPASELAHIHDISEGLENKIKKAAETAATYEELMTGILSKRYTKTRIQRILIYILLNIKKSDFHNEKPRYARILAFNNKGKAIIKRMKKTADIPIITNINKVHLDEDAEKMLMLDIQGTNIYNLLTSQKSGGDDYTKQPIMCL